MLNKNCCTIKSVSLISVVQSLPCNHDNLLNCRQVNFHSLSSAVSLLHLLGMHLFLMLTAICTVGKLPITPVAAVGLDVSMNAYHMLFVRLRAFKLSLTELACVSRHFAVLQLMLAQCSTCVEHQAALIALVAGRAVCVHVLS